MRFNGLKNILLLAGLLCPAKAFCTSSSLLQIWDSDGTNQISFATPATGTLVSNYTLTWPAAIGANGAVLSTNAAGVLSWSLGSAKRTCMMVSGSDNGVILANADIAPQAQQCYIPANATVLEINVRADGGTPSVVAQRRRGAAVVDLTSAALSTAASGGAACAMSTTSQTCLDSTTSSASVTLTNTSLSAGDWIETRTATAGGVAKRMSIAVVYVVN